MKNLDILDLIDLLMNNPFLSETDYPLKLPILIFSEEEAMQERIEKRQAIRALRNYAKTSRNTSLVENIYKSVGFEPSGLRKPCANANNVIDYVIRAKYKGCAIPVLNELYGVNFLLMIKIVAYAKFEHHITIKYDDQSNSCFWIPNPDSTINKYRSINQIRSVKTKIIQPVRSNNAQRCSICRSTGSQSSKKSR